MDDETISLFSQYIGFDSLEPSHLTFNTSQLEQERGVMLERYYPEVLSIFGNIYRPEFKYSEMTVDDKRYLQEMLSDSVTGIISGSTIEYEVAALETVRRNVFVMNSLADEGGGVINNEGEFIFNDTNSEEDLSENFTDENDVVDSAFDHSRLTWTLDILYLSWSGFSIDLGSGTALVFSLFCIMSYLSVNIANPIVAFQQLSQDDAIASLFVELFIQIPDDLASGLVGLKSYAVLATLTNLISIFLTITSSLSLTLKIITLVVTLCLPSIVDSVLILYNAIAFYKGANITYNWNVFGDWKYWGISFRPIDSGE